ncbi:MAG: tripartite tricarboxylate transporter substrate binding protein [Alphaproteobacteria bacterium]|nr:tripartite tricarboxylate transporter substrate binding protein [Alphaproteobacteria bacterium]
MRALALFAVGAAWLGLAAGAAWVGLPSAADAQTYPNRPVKLVVPFAAGGNTDVMGRVLAAKMSELLGQQVTVENRTGAGSVVGTEIVARSAPDGYTLLLTTVAHAANPAFYKKLTYDAVKDFEPIGLAAISPLVLEVHPSIPATDTKSLIKLLKDNPGKYSYGSAGTGSAIFLACELFKRMAGVDVVHVPYRGAGPMLNDLVAGQVAMAIDATSTSMPHVNSGALRGLAVSTPTRIKAAPNLPTIAETLPGYQGYTWGGLFAPAGTPKPIIEQLAGALAKTVADATVRQRMEELGNETNENPTPEGLAKFLADERTKWLGLFEGSDIRLD